MEARLVLCPAGYFTEMAIIVLHNMVLKNKDEGYSLCCIFLDLSRAFGAVKSNLIVQQTI